MSNKETVFQNDQRLMEMAGYYESKGMIRPIQDHDKLFTRFSEFKMLVKRGEFTMDELEERIFSQFGITTPQNSIDLKEMLLNTIKMTQELQEKKKKKNDKTKEK